MKPVLRLAWCPRKIADALGIPDGDVREYMTDGRRVSFLVERRLALEQPRWCRARSEGAGYDLVDPRGGLWEVRSVTRGGIYFCPSNQVGSGRKFNKAEFFKKLESLTGYIVTDIEGFPEMDVYKIPSGTVRQWWDAGMLGETTKVSRKHFLEILAEVCS